MPCNCELDVLGGRSQHLNGCQFNSAVQNGAQNDGNKMERHTQNVHSGHHPHRKLHDEEGMEGGDVNVDRDLVRLDIFLNPWISGFVLSNHFTGSYK